MRHPAEDMITSMNLCPKIMPFGLLFQWGSLSALRSLGRKLCVRVRFPHSKLLMAAGVPTHLPLLELLGLAEPVCQSTTFGDTGVSWFLLPVLSSQLFAPLQVDVHVCSTDSSTRATDECHLLARTRVIRLNLSSQSSRQGNLLHDLAPLPAGRTEKLHIY